MFFRRRSFLSVVAAATVVAGGLCLWFVVPRAKTVETPDSAPIKTDLPSMIFDDRSRWRLTPSTGSLAPGEIDGTRAGIAWTDATGPLRATTFTVLSEAIGEILDLCVTEDAVAAFSGARDMPAESDIVQVVTETQYALGCRGSGPVVMKGRYAYVPPFGGELQFFESRHQAVIYGEDLQRRLGVGWHENPSIGSPLGFHSGTMGTASYGTGVTAGAEDLRVIPGSVSANAGVLRGLVRNRSATHFAYRVEVAVGDLAWEWPLSVQPGELAPFEIQGWRSDEIPQMTELVVSAEMSTDVDLSRQFQFHEMWQRGVIARQDFATYLPRSVIAEFPAETEVATFLTANDVVASSHPSLAEPTRNLETFPVAAYVAWVRSDGSIADIDQLILSEYDDFVDSDGHSRIRPFEVHLYSRAVHAGTVNLAFAADPRDPFLDGYLLWIGGIHE
ncbi:hypothetical protein [Candidatus Poriferisodalis sp.]|uniref:hypothetical protein n=1 Tax=Candidatus Poriferisodalis sp. TaxID=3101277 RepID=UPI003B020239